MSRQAKTRKHRRRTDRCGLGGPAKEPGPHRDEPSGEEPENTDAAPTGADSAARLRNPDRTASAEPSGEEPENTDAAPTGADSAARLRNPDRTALSRQAKSQKTHRPHRQVRTRRPG